MIANASHNRTDIIFDSSWLILIFLGAGSGFCAAYLGVGGSVFIVPLLPFLTGLDPLNSLRLSLSLIFVISFVNSLAFIGQRLVLWPSFIKGVLGALGAALLSGFFVTYLSAFQIRLTLWFFLSLILGLPFILKKYPFLKNKGIYIFSTLMGICSGFTGLGGGMILSPYFHESRQIPLKNIPALVSCIMFCVSVFSLLGQMLRTNYLPFSNFSQWKMYFFLLLIPSLMGLIFGYVANIRHKNLKWRRLILRVAVGVMFVTLSFEMMDKITQLKV